MKTVNIYHAKTQLSKLISAALEGTDVVIARNGQPLVRLVPFQERKERRLGTLKGKVRMAKDFDAPLPSDLLKAFEGEE